MDAIQRATTFHTRDLNCNGGKLKGSTMNKAKSTADIGQNTRSILGDIHNVNRDNRISKLCNGVQNKLSIGRKAAFLHVKSKVDSNLHPVNKTVIRRHQSITNLETTKTAQVKAPKIETKLKPAAKLDSKSILNPYLTKLNTEDIVEEINLTPEMIRDLDLIEYADRLNPLMVVEYKKEIYDYLLSLEDSDPVRQNFLEGQAITKKMREILLSWLIDVHAQFKCLLETLHMTISILDRFLMKVDDITKENYQLVGVGAMVLACKYEELYVPDVSDFVYMCQNAFSKQEIRNMEYRILRALKFNLSPPVPIHFLRRYSKVAHAEPIHHAMSKYFVELLLFDYATCHYKPSQMAAAAICFSFTLLNKDVVMPYKVWTPALQYYSTYRYNNIHLIIRKLARILLKITSPKDHPIAKKYSDAKYMKVSKHSSLQSMVMLKLVAKD